MNINCVQKIQRIFLDPRYVETFLKRIFVKYKTNNFLATRKI